MLVAVWKTPYESSGYETDTVMVGVVVAVHEDSFASSVLLGLLSEGLTTGGDVGLGGFAVGSGSTCGISGTGKRSGVGGFTGGGGAG